MGIKVRVPAPRLHPYDDLLVFLSEPLTAENWGWRLQLADLWQEPELLTDYFPEVLESDDDSKWASAVAWAWGQLHALECPKIDRDPALKIDGLVASYEGTKNLQRELQERLTLLAEGKSPTPVGNEGPKWRKARVHPSGAMHFEDVGEGLRFLADALGHEIRIGPRQFEGRRGKRWVVPALHLRLCKCGCGRFFLWAGNWKQRDRKFLNDKHRMDFHNRKYVQTGGARSAMRKWREENPEHKLKRT